MSDESDKDAEQPAEAETKRPFQFTIRHLIFWTAVVAVLLAIFTQAEPTFFTLFVVAGFYGYGMVVRDLISGNKGSTKKNMKRLAIVSACMVFGSIIGYVVILILSIGDYIYLQRQNFHAFILPAACVILTGVFGSKSQQIPIKGVIICPLYVSFIYWCLETQVSAFVDWVPSWTTLSFILVFVLPSCVLIGILGAAQSIHASDKEDKALTDGAINGDDE